MATRNYDFDAFYEINYIFGGKTSVTKSSPGGTFVSPIISKSVFKNLGAKYLYILKLLIRIHAFRFLEVEDEFKKL